MPDRLCFSGSGRSKTGGRPKWWTVSGAAVGKTTVLVYQYHEILEIYTFEDLPRS